MLKMKDSKNKTMYFFLFCIILFQIFLLGFIIRFHNEIYFNPSVKPISYEYWNWLISHPEATNNELVHFVNAVSITMNIIFMFGLILVFALTELTQKMKVPKILLSFLSAYIIYKISSLIIRNLAADYRLYMDLIPTEILSLLLLFFILKALNKDTL